MSDRLYVLLCLVGFVVATAVSVALIVLADRNGGYWLVLWIPMIALCVVAALGALLDALITVFA